MRAQSRAEAWCDCCKLLAGLLLLHTHVIFAWMEFWGFGGRRAGRLSGSFFAITVIIRDGATGSSAILR